MPQNPTSFTIKDWAEEDRPREKFLHLGPRQMSNAELLAILIGSGSKGQSAVALMQQLMAQNQHQLSKLYAAPVATMMQVKGIGPTKAIKIKAALTSAFRLANSPTTPNVQLNSSQEVFALIRPLFMNLVNEEFWVLYLNNSNRLLSKKQLSSGGMTQTVVDVRLAFKWALEVGATALILVHNHPSGNPKPSAADRKITTQFQHAAAHFDLQVLDHLIYFEKGYFSFADEKLL
jgi:DNA repair protein RadC